MSESRLRNNGLTIAMTSLFLGSFVGQVIVGHHAYNAEARDHAEAAITLGTYLASGHFIEAVFENWESEFLQMGLLVVLTKYLRQKGSSESKKLDGPEDVDEDPRAHRDDPGVPWPVKKGGLVLLVYERSLSSLLFLMFVVSFVLHAVGGAREATHDALRHGGAPLSTLDYLASSRFWFESLQNWQSEFISVGVLIVLSIYLRERGSSQSKPVFKPHSETGK